MRGEFVEVDHVVHGLAGVGLLAAVLVLLEDEVLPGVVPREGEGAVFDGGVGMRRGTLGRRELVVLQLLRDLLHVQFGVLLLDVELPFEAVRRLLGRLQDVLLRFREPDLALLDLVPALELRVQSV